jgi:phosphatidylinositol alpha-1,6-mannosyltransferase
MRSPMTPGADTSRSAPPERDAGAGAIARLPKSLLVVRDYFPPQVGGISKMMASVCQLLGAENISCATAVSGAQSLLDGRGQPINVHYVPSLFAPGRARMLTSLALVWPRLLLRERPQLLQFATCQDAYWGLALQKTLRIPFLIYAHGNEVLDAASIAWDRPREALRSAACVVANSGYTARLLTEKIRVNPDRIRILHPGCDTKRFSPDATPDEARRLLGDLGGRAPILLSVGNLVERKGHDLVLRALPQLKQRWPGLLYVVVGDGPFRPALEALAEQLGVASSVRFAGRVDSAALPAFYRLCDVFVMPSRLRAEHHDVEGFGIVYIEAGACGKPVVGGLSGGTEDAIAEGETGLLVDPGDANALAAALARILEDPGFARTLGENARRRAAAEFTWAAFAGKLRSELAAIAAS